MNSEGSQSKNVTAENVERRGLGQRMRGMGMSFVKVENERTYNEALEPRSNNNHKESG
jgi:hypothetical protein